MIKQIKFKPMEETTKVKVEIKPTQCPDCGASAEFVQEFE